MANETRNVDALGNNLEGHGILNNGCGRTQHDDLAQAETSREIPNVLSDQITFMDPVEIPAIKYF